MSRFEISSAIECPETMEPHMKHLRLNAAAAALLFFPATASAQHSGHMDNYNPQTGYYTQQGYQPAPTQQAPAYQMPAYNASHYQAPTQIAPNYEYVTQPQQPATLQHYQTTGYHALEPNHDTYNNSRVYSYKKSLRRYNRQGAEITGCVASSNQNVYSYKGGVRRYNHQGAEYLSCSVR